MRVIGKVKSVALPRGSIPRVQAVGRGARSAFRDRLRLADNAVGRGALLCRKASGNLRPTVLRSIFEPADALLVVQRYLERSG